MYVFKKIYINYIYKSIVQIKVRFGTRLLPHVHLSDFMSIHDLCTREPIMGQTRYIRMYSVGICLFAQKMCVHLIFLLRCHKTYPMVTYACTVSKLSAYLYILSVEKLDGKQS